MSPPSRRRLHRQATNTTPSSSSSRTESPRFTKEQESQYGVIKMKKSSARLNPNRNSASLQTSTLQEDLIKLIGKDFEHAGKTINSKLKVSYFLLLFELIFVILTADQNSMLNKRDEFVETCRHQRKHLLVSLTKKKEPPDTTIK